MNRNMFRQLYDTGAPGGGGGGGTPPDWKATLPDDIKSHASLATLKDVNDLAKGYVNAQQLIGAKRIALPGEKATDAEREEFYKAIGRPESLEKYTEGTVKPREGLTVDQAGLAKAKEQMFKLGLTDAQQKGIMDFYLTGLNESHGKLTGDLEASRVQAEEALRKEWGQSYEVNLGIAKNVLTHFGDEQTATELSGVLGNNPGLIKLLHKFGATLGEDQALSKKFSAEAGTPAAAQARIIELQKDTAFQKALNDNTDPGHKAAVELWTQVHRQLG
jgi:hypothetical protein